MRAEPPAPSRYVLSQGDDRIPQDSQYFFGKAFPSCPLSPLLPPPPAPSPLLPRGLRAHSLPPASLRADGGYDYIWGPEPPRRRPAWAALFPNLHPGERASGLRWGRAGDGALTSARCAPSSGSRRPAIRVPSPAARVTGARGSGTGGRCASSPSAAGPRRAQHQSLPPPPGGPQQPPTPAPRPERPGHPPSAPKRSQLDRYPPGCSLSGN